MIRSLMNLLICWTVDARIRDKWMQRAINLEANPQDVVCAVRACVPGDYAALFPSAAIAGHEDALHVAAELALSVQCR
jgi:hypothetical protein